MKHIFTSQSEKRMARNRGHRILEAILDSQHVKYNSNRTIKSTTRIGRNHVGTQCRHKKDKDDGSNVSLSGDTNYRQGQNNKDEHMPAYADNHADTFQMPDITICDYLSKCPVRKEQKCFFDFGYESCQVNKFYERWG